MARNKKQIKSTQISKANASQKAHVSSDPNMAQLAADMSAGGQSNATCYGRVQMNRAIGKLRQNRQRESLDQGSEQRKIASSPVVEIPSAPEMKKNAQASAESNIEGKDSTAKSLSDLKHLSTSSISAALKDLSRLREGALARSSEAPEERNDWMLRCLGADTTVMLELAPDGEVVRTECHGGGGLGDWWRVAMLSFKGANFLDLIDTRDRDSFARVLSDTAPGERILPRTVRLAWSGAKAPRLVVQGLRDPLSPADAKATDSTPDSGTELATKLGEASSSQSSHFRIGVTQSGLSRGLSRAAAGRDADYGVLDLDTFLKAAVGRIFVGEATRRRRQITFIELKNIAALFDGLTMRSRQALSHDIGGYLQAISVGGDSACLISPNCFAVLHTTDVSRFSMSRALIAICNRSQAQSLLDIQHASIDLDVTGATEDEIGETIKYAANAFVAQVAASDEDTASTPDLALGFADQAPDPIAKRLLFGTQKKGSQLTGRWKSIVQTAAGQFSLPEDFFMVFQPVVNLSDMRPCHFEALARFSNGDKTANVIRFIEQAGFTEDFDLSVVERLCKSLSGRAGLAPVAVNLSARSLQGEGFIDQLLRILDTHKMPGDKMMFEITETADIGALARVNMIVQKLRGRGHKVSLDDFGSGAAAFHYLRALEVDTIKIDGIYIHELPTSLRDQVVVQAIAGMCNGLKMETVAEMVETQEQLEELQSIGVKFGQGFLFGRPQELTLDELTLQ